MRVAVRPANPVIVCLRCRARVRMVGVMTRAVAEAAEEWATDHAQVVVTEWDLLAVGSDVHVSRVTHDVPPPVLVAPWP